MITIIILVSVGIVLSLAISGLIQEVNRDKIDDPTNSRDTGKYTSVGFINENGISRPIRR
jgi:hypothetical protein